MKSRPAHLDDVGGFPWRPLFVATLAGYLVISFVLLTVGELLVNGGVTSSLRTWDLDVSRWAAQHRTPAWNTVTEIGSRSADTLGIVALAVVVEVVLAVRGRRRELVLVAVGLATELACFLTVNTLVDRPRPEVDKLGSVPGTASFPSGHTAATLVVWAAIVVLVRRDPHAPATARAVLARLATAVGVAMVVIVGVSRVYRGMHHVTDVVAGAVMGVGCVLVAIVVQRMADRREVPEIGPVVDERVEVLP